jgi:hypothetical protein
VYRSRQIDKSGDRFLLNTMIEPTETNPTTTGEPDELSESTDTPSNELDDETTQTRGFALPSITLLFALFLLSVTLGIAISAGFFLWSLSDHPVTPEAANSAQLDRN